MAESTMVSFRNAALKAGCYLDKECLAGRVQLVAQTKDGSFPVTLYLMADGTVQWAAPFAVWCASGPPIGADPTGKLDD